MVKLTLIISFFIVIADQITKYFADDLYPATFNTGIAFGLFQGSKFILNFSIVVAVLVIFLILKERDKLNKIGAGLLLGGTIGNLIDRVYYKFVIDWIFIGNFPAFNIADAANVIGVLLIIFISPRANAEKIESQ